MPPLQGSRQWTEFRRSDPDTLDNVFFAPSDDGAVPRVTTDRGIGIGSTLAQVEAAYGKNLRRDIFYPEVDPYAGLVVFGKQGAMIFGFVPSGAYEDPQQPGPDARVDTLQIASGHSLETLDYFVGAAERDLHLQTLGVSRRSRTSEIRTSRPCRSAWCT